MDRTMLFVRRRLLELLLPAVIVGILLGAPAQAGHGASAPGDLFVSRVSGGDAAVEWYHPDGSPNRPLKGGKARSDGGMAFDAAGNLYLTDYGKGRILKYDRSGNAAGTFANGLDKPNSIVFDKAGNAYVGQQNDIDLVKLDPQGRRLSRVDLDVVKGGETGQIDLGPDQCTLYYRSARHIRRFDVCRGRERGDFAELDDKGNENKRSLRSTPSGEVLVADQDKIIRLDPSGRVVKRYDVDGEDGWYHLALDPTAGGESFWAAGRETGKVYRFDLGTGGIERKLAISNVSGLAVQPVPTPPPARPPAPPPAKTPAVEGGKGAKSDAAPTTATRPFASKGTGPATPDGVPANTSAAPAASATAPSAPQAPNLGRSPAAATIPSADQAGAEGTTGSSDAAGDSGDLSMSELDFGPPSPQAEPQPPVLGPLVAPQDTPEGAPVAAPREQDRKSPRLRLGMGAQDRYQGFLASGRGTADEGRPFMVGAAAVMLFGAALASRRRSERARAIPLSARARTYPRRS